MILPSAVAVVAAAFDGGGEDVARDFQALGIRDLAVGEFEVDVLAFAEGAFRLQILHDRVFVPSMTADPPRAESARPVTHLGLAR